ncbi:MAG: LarC family nickel insertion protein [Nitrospirae bacterium]|nr:LarC family nickel insertion protein [Nitrospirota bacterium]
MKVGPHGAAPRYRPEHDDVARIARETGRGFIEVAEELSRLAIDALEAL